MNKLIIDPNNFMNYKLITTDNYYELLSFSYEVRSYNYRSGRYELTDFVDSISSEDSEAYYIPRGFGLYLYSLKDHFKLTEESIKLLEYDLESKIDYSDFNWSNLRDYQQNDLKELLQVKRGIFQNYTGYGKSEVISRLVEFYYSKGFNVLILCGGSKSLDELRNRIKLRTNIELPSYFDESSKINIISPNGFVRSGTYESSSDSYWSSIDICIADEVEMMASNSAFEVFEQLCNCEYYYGFGATADDKKGERIDIINQLQGINSSVGKWITGVFSMAIVYVQPKDLIINIKPYDVKMSIDFSEVDSSNIYRDIIYNIWSNTTYLNSIIDICNSNDHITFIPMNDLSFIDEVFYLCRNEGLSVCTITGQGYYLNDSYISIEELKNRTHEVNVILGTTSAFRALDIKNLTSVVLTVGTKASQILQQVGRAARNPEFVIWYIRNSHKLPIYTRHTEEQLELIRNYYKLCKINEYK